MWGTQSSGSLPIALEFAISSVPTPPKATALYSVWKPLSPQPVPSPNDREPARMKKANPEPQSDLERLQVHTPVDKQLPTSMSLSCVITATSQLR